MYYNDRILRMTVQLPDDWRLAWWYLTNFKKAAGNNKSSRSKICQAKDGTLEPVISRLAHIVNIIEINPKKYEPPIKLALLYTSSSKQKSV